MSMSSVRVPALHWVIEESDLDILKAGGPMLGATPPIDVVMP